MAYKDITRDQFVPKADQLNFIQIVVDFSKKLPVDQTLNITTYTDGAKIALPVQKMKISAWATDVRTAEGTAATADIGITGALTQWHDDLDINAVAVTASLGAELSVDNSAGDKFITIKPSVDLDTAKLHLSFTYKVIDK